MKRELNEEQQIAVNTLAGPVVCVAGPGSGKTTVIVERFRNLLSQGVLSSDILTLTFTKQAAEEMTDRAGYVSGSPFRTFHSYALDLLKREREHIGFNLTPEILPVPNDTYETIISLLRTFRAIPSYKTLVEGISSFKRRGLNPEQALKDSYGNGVEFLIARAYGEYERICRENGWLDFDSLMVEAVKLLRDNEAVRLRNQFEYVQVDEGQDTDSTQFQLLQLIAKKNIFVVGDENQCQPPGTMICILRSPKQGSRPAIINWIPIEFLCPSDRLVSWDSHEKKMRLGTGRKFRKASREFDGYLLEFCSNGHKTRVTPNHFVWVKFNREKLKAKSHFVYLMWKKELGYRVGTSALRTVGGSNQISHRGYQEQADKMWILDVVNSGKEARIREEIYSLQYQIPERVFQDNDAARIFKSVHMYGGLRLLADKGLEFDYPLVSWDKREKHLTKFHGYFKTAACNVLEGLMDLPTQKSYVSAVVEKVKKVKYCGLVYSLDVERDHTYVADGIPVGNCIYEWRSAMPGSLLKFSEKFPGTQTLYLGTNYRSTQAIVKFLKDILPVDNGLASHMKPGPESPEGFPPTITQYIHDEHEATRVIDSIKDPEHTAIIARTNRQLELFRSECLRRGMKFIFLGKSGFWDGAEVKKLISIVKEQHINSRKAPADVVESAIVANDLRGKFKTQFKFGDSDPVENLNAIYKIAARFKTVPEFLSHVNKISHATRNRTGVTLSTVHQMKGKEADHVYLVGVDQGVMPHHKGEYPEEQRIFYVACSRAAKFLHISYTAMPSMFIHPFMKIGPVLGDVPGTQPSLFGG